MIFTDLISTADLAENIHNPEWIIVDCRFDLNRPDWGFEDYQQGHIPGAVYAHLDRDLSGPKTPQTGRHPLPEKAELFSSFSTWGIGAGKQVIIYDTTGGSFAGRLWWMLRLYSHKAAAVLDGGYPQWLAEGRPIRTGVETNLPTQFSGQLHPEMMVGEEEVERIRRDSNYRLVDARTPERFRGEIEPLDPVAGHIPGAVNRFHGLNLNPDGTMKSAETLKKEYESLINGVNPENVVVYCGSGVTSIHHLLAMERAGLKGGKLYVGSWSQWIRDPNRSIARGPD
jgi:thiosulfate/3-mercaptopyruvate sulfurtransferase